MRTRQRHIVGSDGLDNTEFEIACHADTDDSGPLDQELVADRNAVLAKLNIDF